jgi:uncharacterized membrane protein
MRLAPTLCTIAKEAFFMKTSNLAALIIALVISIGGFAGIDRLFTRAYDSHERPSVALILNA